jgi:CBS-domain-containing membrane protein
MTNTPPVKPPDDAVAEGWPVVELSDDDILDAMQHLSGYLDINTEDFRSIYQLAHRHALVRMFDGITAERIMRTPVPSVNPDDTLDVAAKQIFDSGYKGLAVVDELGRVIGMLTETDYLKRFDAANVMELLLNRTMKSFELASECSQTRVSDSMTRSPISVSASAAFREIIEAFSLHEGRSMPVISGEGRLVGMLLRKDVLRAFYSRELH